MKPLTIFASQFGARVALNPEFIVEKTQRYYLLNPKLRKIARPDFYYAGLYLGKVKNGVFFPSFNFLNMLADVAANKIVINRKAAWLFICGRDLFPNGILKIQGSKKKGEYALIMNEAGDCLGFGMIVVGLEIKENNQMAIRNILDIGDFLRRES